MPTSAAVASGEITPTLGGTLDLTSAGFGTPDAAIIFTTTANSSNNPYTGSSAISIGFWDGTNNIAAGVSSAGNLGSSDTYRESQTDTVVVRSSFECTAAAITNGVRLTVTLDSTDFTRRVSVILLKGLTSAKAFAYQLGTATTPYDINTVGFQPNAGFILTNGNSAQGVAAHSILSIGAFHDNGTTVTQSAVAISDLDNVTSTNAESYYDHQNAAMQHHNSSATWTGSVGSFDADGFSFTPSANPGSDYIYVLALEFANTADFHISTETLATVTGDDAKTGYGLTPDVVGMLACHATANQTTTAGLAFMAGIADSSSQVSLHTESTDGQSTTSTSSAFNTSNIVEFARHTGAVNAIASLSSMDSDGFTLNYSDAASSAFKALTFTIGDSTAGSGYDLAVSSAGVAVSGQSTSLKASRKVSASSIGLSIGTELVSLGKDSRLNVLPVAIQIDQGLVDLSVGASLSVQSSSLSVSGQVVGLERTRSVSATANQIRVVGNVVSMPFTNAVSGGGKPRRKRRKHYIEIDGQLVAVDSPQQARKLLAELKPDRTPPPLKKRVVKGKPTPVEPEEPVVVLTTTKSFPAITPLKMIDAKPWQQFERESQRLIAEQEEALLLLLLAA